MFLVNGGRLIMFSIGNYLRDDFKKNQSQVRIQFIRGCGEFETIILLTYG